MKKKISKLESNLLGVSKPYELQVGDTVRNINPTCTHYRSVGRVVYVHPDGDITYQVNNQGATFAPGDQLTKSGDQLMKVFTHTPRPGYGMFSNESIIKECVVAKIPVEGKTILAKNRDRGYKAQVEIVHELIDGVEVVYVHDRVTDWSEGMNEFGIGLVNASLTVEFDEKEGDLAKQQIDKGKAPRVSHDGLKIRKALGHKKLSEVIDSVISYVGEDKKDVGIKGQTIVANPKHAFIIEMTSKHLPVIKKIKKDELLVRTNHGIEYPETGYTKGVKRRSSISRKEISEDELSKVKKVDGVLDTLSKQYTEDPFMNPYRRQNKYDMETTSQIMYDLDDLVFYLRWDVDHSSFAGIINNLPKDYKPKIKIVVAKTD